ncbi:MAG: D-2-hydroxyacid dehydrogenase [Dehalococcoidales bacterium]
MEPVNVLILTSLGEESRQRIAGVSPRITVTDVADKLRAERKGDFSSKKELDALLAEGEVLYGFRLPPGILGRTPKLKWIQTMSAGVEHFMTDEVKQNRAMVTNASGLHAGPIAEYILGQMLMFVKRSPFCFQFQQDQVWQKVSPSVLRGKTLGIVGLGSIGRETARLAKAFGMRVLATRRSVKQTGKARNVDTLYPAKRLPELLAESDFVALTLPFTPATSKIIGEKELGTMKSGAFLINIARGGVVDEEALARALEEGWIAGAGLDVFATEPLPAESRLWGLSNLVITPHISGGSDEDNTLGTTRIFVENLKRYIEGRKLLNMVSKKHGY